MHKYHLLAIILGSSSAPLIAAHKTPAMSGTVAFRSRPTPPELQADIAIARAAATAAGKPFNTSMFIAARLHQILLAGETVEVDAASDPAGATAAPKSDE